MLNVRLLAAPEDNLFVVGDDDQPWFETRTYSSAVFGAVSAPSVPEADRPQKLTTWSAQSVHSASCAIDERRMPSARSVSV